MPSEERPSNDRRESRLVRLLRDEPALVAVLAGAVLLLVFASPPGPFSIDECNYLTSAVAIRHGTVMVPGTEHLTPSADLLAFDPSRAGRAVSATPVAPAVPPLWAPLAAPLFPLGWRALVAINAVSIGLATALLFFYVRSVTGSRPVAALGAALFFLGGTVIEYGSGVWPHALCVALAFGAFALAYRARTTDSLLVAGGAGLLAAWAAGIRYQNVLLVVALGLTLLIWHRRRIAAGLSFVAGAAPLLLATSFVNWARLGTFNPITKGGRYLEPRAPTDFASHVADALLALYARVIDFSATPGLYDVAKEPLRGAFLVIGGLKKAWLQSSPWMAVALVVLVLAWLPPRLGDRALGLDERAQAVRRELRVMSVPIAFVLAAFSWAGTARSDGWCFNQRYLLELVPLMAAAVVLGLSPRPLRKGPLALGALAGVALALPGLLSPPGSLLRIDSLQSLSVFLALAWGGVYGLSRLPSFRERPRFEQILAAGLGLGLGWALAVHIGDDVSATNRRRSLNASWIEIARQNIDGDRIGLVTVTPTQDALCVLHLDRDLVLVDPFVDDYAAPVLVAELLQQRRRVFVSGWMPAPLLGALGQGRPLRDVGTPDLPLVEIVAVPLGATHE